MSDLTNDEIHLIGYQDPVDSFPHRENYRNIKNRHNQTNQAVAALSSAASGAEISTARPYHSSLLLRLNETELGHNYVKMGFEVAQLPTPVMKIRVSAGKAQVGGSHISLGFGTWTRSGSTITMTEPNHGRTTGNQIIVDDSSDTGALPLGTYTITVVDANTWATTGVNSGATSGSSEHASILGPFTAPVSNTRFDVACINSDNSLSVSTGMAALHPFLPPITSTQRALSQITLQSSTTSIINSLIRDCSQQGVFAAGNYFWKIQDAIDFISSRSNEVSGGDLQVFEGDYYEEPDFGLIKKIHVFFETTARLIDLSGNIQSRIGVLKAGKKRQVFTTSGTLVNTSYNNIFDVILVAGGGGGGSGMNGGGGGGGGGGGEYKRQKIECSNANISIIVGAGGTGGASGAPPGNAGQDGGLSSFDGVCAHGGYGGGRPGDGGIGGNNGYGVGRVVTSTGVSGGGGDSGTSVSSDGGPFFTFSGGVGHSGGGSPGFGGGGGAGPFGNGGDGGPTANASGSSASANTGAGGGGGTGGAGSGSGGDGGSGLIIVEWEE